MTNGMRLMCWVPYWAVLPETGRVRIPGRCGRSRAQAVITEAGRLLGWVAPADDASVEGSA